MQATRKEATITLEMHQEIAERLYRMTKDFEILYGLLSGVSPMPNGCAKIDEGLEVTRQQMIQRFGAEWDGEAPYLKVDAERTAASTQRWQSIKQHLHAG